MKLGKTLAGILLSLPLFAQYPGPAILTRGDAPAGLSGPQIDFRPFVELMGVYDTGLAAAIVNAQGQLANDSSAGVQLTAGISGSHQWRHTVLGLTASGSLTDYTRFSSLDNASAGLLLGFSHQFTRHLIFTSHTSAGVFNYNFGNTGLSQTASFDPLTLYTPVNDFFDTQTVYVSTQADMIIHVSPRLSFDVGGTGFLTRLRSTALYGVAGGGAHGDLQYRISRRTTVGANYSYTRYSFNRVFSEANLHTWVATFARGLTQRLEFTAYAGISRSETSFVQIVPVDPVVAAIIGRLSSTAVVHTIQYLPNYNGRLSLKFSRGVGYLYGGHTVTPGNGLFLTSTSSQAGAGYTFTGLRRWSFTAGANANLSYSYSNVDGHYNSYGGTLTASRQLWRTFHFVSHFSELQYASGSFAAYNRRTYDVRVGFGWSPGDIPLRIW